MSVYDISWRKYILPPIHSEGWRFIASFAAVSALLGILFKPLALVGLVVTIWCFYFFRDPERVTPEGEDLVISPADGIVQMITETAPPKELEMGDEPVKRVSIFMSVFNVHVNRVPATGTIMKTVYVPGKFFNATLDKASEDNERQLLLLETKKGSKKIAFVQIAGLVARRILCEVMEEQEMKAGERFGLIRFGSRLDVYLPKGIEPKVCIGQTAIAGETILANLEGKQAEIKGEVL
ncbi:MAG: phosphatidylserine decarboxylase [Alphaproteobacteria bacterium]